MSSLRGRIETGSRSLRDRPAPGCYRRDQGAHGRAGRTRRTRGRLVRPFYNGAMDGVPSDRDLAAIGLLQDPVRRALYGHVVAAGGEVSRNQAAEAAGVARSLAAFHLD